MLGPLVSVVARRGGRSSGDESAPRDDGNPPRDGSGRTTATGSDGRFLLPEEEVLALLDRRTGRMWQQDVVAETGYSAGKVSRLLGEMEEEGLIARYWIDGKKIVVSPELSPGRVTKATRSEPQ